MLPMFLKAFACLAPLTGAQCDNATASDWLLYDSGASYLNLPEVDNWSRLNDAQTVWRKLKLLQDPQVGDASVIVSLVDTTFADVSGAEAAPWGLASDCRGSPFSGTMQVNLLNTPFRYEAVLPDATGYKAFGSVSCQSPGLQNCSASCGGLCGFCGLGEQTVTQAELPVVDQCAFDMGVQAWVTTTTSTGTRTTLTSTLTSSVTSSTTTYLGPTSTSTTTITSLTSSTSATVTSTSTATVSITSSSTTTSTTTQVNGYYYYRFTPTQIADEGGSCCCAHAVAELYFRNCGADVDMASVSASNPGGSWQSRPPSNAVDLRLETKWRDSNRRPLILASPELMPVDSYSGGLGIGPWCYGYRGCLEGDDGGDGYYVWQVGADVGAAPRMIGSLEQEMGPWSRQTDGLRQEVLRLRGGSSMGVRPEEQEGYEYPRGPPQALGGYLTAQHAQENADEYQETINPVPAMPRRPNEIWKCYGATGTADPMSHLLEGLEKVIKGNKPEELSKSVTIHPCPLYTL
ncbi:unnamed protein product [Symbiodinium sp. CCMP2592]|nr:unnamed protein product [Symbiodinium sp. CCMP2592]